MNERPSLADLGAFAAIMAHRSFRKAADEAGLSPSTLSHMMRSLEVRINSAERLIQVPYVTRAAPVDR